MYAGGTCQDSDLYACQFRRHDPEGMLGLLNAIVLCYLGYHAGRIFATYKDLNSDGVHPSSRRVVARFAVWALICGLGAGALCGFSKDEGWIPINKNLWSASFILAMASGGYLVLAILHILIDHHRFGVWSGAPFRYMGMNSILIYVGSHYLTKFPFGFPHADTHAGETASTTMLVCSWMMVAYYWYANDFFVTI